MPRLSLFWISLGFTSFFGSDFFKFLAIHTCRSGSSAKLHSLLPPSELIGGCLQAFFDAPVDVLKRGVEEATSQKPKNVFPFFPTRSNLLDWVNESGYSEKGKKPNSEKEPSEAKRKNDYK